MNYQALKKILLNTALLMLIILPGILVFSRCANQGMPTGGPKDSIPPVPVDISPALRSMNFKGKEVRITFNEYILPDAVSDILVVSPPLSKRPSIRTKGRALIVEFNEELKPDVTYSMDFKNSVVDNNENNPYKGLRLLFSTGSTIDTLRVAGVVKDAEKLDTQEKIVVALYNNLLDTAVTRSRPDYVARTDSRGVYFFDNVKPGRYRLYAFKDDNTNYKYDAGTEAFGFCDSVIVPSAVYNPLPDSTAVGADSALISGNTLFRPAPVFLRLYTEKIFDQFVNKTSRENRNKCIISFGESVKDTFGLRLLNRKARDWYSLEYNPEMDSLIVWVTDTLVARYDTLKFELAFNQLDSLKHKFLKRDTVQLIYTEKEKPDIRKKKKENEAPEVLQFYMSSNLTAAGFDLNIPILLTSPEPVRSFDPAKIRLTRSDDVKATPLKINVKKDTIKWRTFRIDYAWEPYTGYLFEMDSMAFMNIYGVTSQKVRQPFMTQKDDYYGRIILDLSSVETRLVVQLLSNNKEEKVIKELITDRNGKIVFDFLPPEKFKVRVIFDDNRNGKWDPGNFDKKIQPERVAYLPEIVKVRSNWDNQYAWDMKPDPAFRKNLIDKEEEMLRLKKLKEEKQKEADKEKNQPVESPGRFFGNPGRP
jgi:hypothetical protein